MHKTWRKIANWSLEDCHRKPNSMDQRNSRTFPGHFNQNSTVPGQSDFFCFFQDFSRTAIIFQVHHLELGGNLFFVWCIQDLHYGYWEGYQIICIGPISEYVFCFWPKVRPCRPIGVHEQCMSSCFSSDLSWILPMIRILPSATGWISTGGRLLVQIMTPKAGSSSDTPMSFFSGCEAVMVSGTSFCFFSFWKALSLQCSMGCLHLHLSQRVFSHYSCVLHTIRTSLLVSGCCQ